MWRNCWMCGKPLAGTTSYTEEPRHSSCGAAAIELETASTIRAEVIAEIIGALREANAGGFAFYGAAADFIEQRFSA